MLFYKFISLELLLLARSIPLKELANDSKFIRNSQLERKTFDSTNLETDTQLGHNNKLDKRDIYQFNNPAVGGIHLPLKMGNIPLLRTASVNEASLDSPTTPDESAESTELFGVLQIELR